MSGVFGQSPPGAYFAGDGRYYETPEALGSLSLPQQASIITGSVLSSLGLAAAVATGLGALGTTLRGVWGAVTRKSKEAIRGILYKAPFKKKNNKIVDRLAHHILKGQADEREQRDVLLFVFNNDNPANERHVLQQQTQVSPPSSSTHQVVAWLQQRLAAQVVLLPIEVFKAPFARKQQTVSNVRSRLPVAQFIQGLLVPQCNAEVQRHPKLLHLFSLFIAEPRNVSSPLMQSPRPSRLPVSPWAQERQTPETNLTRLSPSLPMRGAVEKLNVTRGAHFVISAGVSPDISLSNTCTQGDYKKIIKALNQRCLLFRRKPVLNMIGATISVGKQFKLNSAKP